MSIDTRDVRSEVREELGVGRDVVDTMGTVAVLAALPEVVQPKPSDIRRMLPFLDDAEIGRLLSLDDIQQQDFVERVAVILGEATGRPKTVPAHMQRLVYLLEGKSLKEMAMLTGRSYHAIFAGLRGAGNVLLRQPGNIRQVLTEVMNGQNVSEQFTNWEDASRQAADVPSGRATASQAKEMITEEKPYSTLEMSQSVQPLGAGHWEIIPGSDDYEGGEDPRSRGAALCAETDPEIFYPEKGGSTREAKKICSRCDIQAQCLEYAIHNDERFGIWGGLSERERRVLRRRAV